MNSHRFSQERGGRGISRLVLVFSSMVPALLVMGILSITHNSAGSSGLASSQVYKLGFFHYQDDFAGAEAAANDFATLLAQQTGLEVEAELYICADEVSKRVGSGQLDGALLDSVTYIHGYESYGYQAELALTQNGFHNYRGQINVRASDNYTDIGGLQGTKFAFSSPGSFSGHLAPYVLISETTGMKPEDFFGEIVFAGSHGQVIRDVYTGTVDGGATFEDARSLVMAEFPDVSTAIEVLTYTEYMPNAPWVFRVGLTPSEVQDLADGIIAVSATDDGKAALGTIIGVVPDGAAPIGDSDFDFIRRVVDVFELQGSICHYVNIPAVLKSGT